MFSIDSENTMRLSIGESSDLFPLFINKGTDKKPIKYEFTPRIRYECRDELQVRIDDELMVKMLGEDGTYSFNFIDGEWMLEDKAVNLEDFGIELNQYVVEPFENITIYFHNSIDEIYFYLYDYNMDITKDDFYIRKTFTAEGTIITDFDNGDQDFQDHVPSITPEGDIWLYIDKDDMRYLDVSEYLYCIKIKMFNFERKQYEMNTIIEPSKFYLIG